MKSATQEFWLTRHEEREFYVTLWSVKPVFENGEWFLTKCGYFSAVRMPDYSFSVEPGTCRRVRVTIEEVE